MKTFTTVIDKFITEKTKSKDPRVPHIYWPSEASLLTSEGVIGKCHRASYYNYTGVAPTDPIHPASIRKMEAGRSIELNEHKFAEQAGILSAHNVKLRKEYDGITISAEIDAVYKHPITGTESIIEIKSLSGYAGISTVFGGKRKSGYPKLDHLLQTTLYLDMYPYEDVFIRYIDRETCDIIEHRITLTEMKIGGVSSHLTTVNGTPNFDFSLERIIDRYRVLDKYISDNKMPPRDFKPMYTASEKAAKVAARKATKTPKPPPLRDWQCSYCRWITCCLSDGE